MTVTAAAAALAVAGACGGDDDGATAEDPGPVPSSQAAVGDTRPDTGPTGPADAFCADFLAWAEETATAEVPEEGAMPPQELAPPEEIAADWFAIDDEPLDTPEQIARAQRIDTWIAENCGAIPGVADTAEPGM